MGTLFSCASLSDRGKWELTPYALGETIQLSSIDLPFSIEQLYADVEFTDLTSPDGAIP